MDESFPPELLDTLFQFRSEWAVIPGIGKTAVDLGSREDESSALAEGHELIEGGSWHNANQHSRKEAKCHTSSFTTAQ